MPDPTDSTGKGTPGEFRIRDQMASLPPEPGAEAGGGRRGAGPAVFAPPVTARKGAPILKPGGADQFLGKIDFRKILHGLLRRKGLIAGITLVLLGLGLIGGFKAGRMKYDSRVSILYRSERQQQLLAASGSTFSMKGLSRTTATSLFRRTSNMEQVITNLHLAMKPDELRWRVETRTEKNSEIILLVVSGCESGRLAVAIANELAHVVLADNGSFYREQAVSAAAQFRKHAEVARLEMDDLARQIVDFQSSNRLIEANADAKAFLDSVATVSERLSNARIAYQSMVIRIQNYRQMISGLPSEVLRESFEDNPLKRRISNTEVALMEARTKYGPDNPRVKQLEDEIREMRRMVADKSFDQSREQVFQPNPVKVQLETERMRLDAERTVLQQNVEELEGEMKAVENRYAFLPRQQLELSVLQQKHLAVAEMAQAMKKSEEGAVIAAQLDLADFEILEPAREASGGRSPLFVVLPVMALLAGLLGGLALAILLELSDPYLRTRRQVEAVYDAPVAQELPRWDGDMRENAQALFLPVCRQVYDRWQRWKAESPCQSIGVFSSVAGEGKSSLAYQAARYCASLGVKTVILDFDWKDNPWLAKGDFKAGVETYLRGEADWTEILAETGNLAAMKVLTPTPDLLELMSTPAMARLWDTIQGRFDLVVVEGPGVLEDQASVFLAGLVNRVVFVIGSPVSEKAEVEKAFFKLEEKHLRPSLLVMNKVAPEYVEKSILAGLPVAGLLAALLAAGAVSCAHVAPPQVLAPVQGPAPAGAAAPAPAHEKPAPECYLPYSPADYRMAVGDVVEVSVFGFKDTVVDIPVAPDGKLYGMFGDGIPAVGREPNEVAHELEARLTRLFNNPNVAILPKSFAAKKYLILGKVQHPGVFPLDSAITIRQALANAGGLAQGIYRGTTIEIASLTESYMLRDGKRLPIDFEALVNKNDPAYDIYMRPGDIIYIVSGLSRSREVYLLGAVAEQKTIAYRDRMTLVELLAGSSDRGGGYTDTANIRRVAILRGSLDKPQTFDVDVGLVLRGKAPDVYLMPGDLVYVPEKPFKYARDLTRMIVLTFVRSFAAEAGSRFVDESLFGTTSTTTVVLPSTIPSTPQASVTPADSFP